LDKAIQENTERREAGTRGHPAVKGLVELDDSVYTIRKKHQGITSADKQDAVL